MVSCVALDSMAASRGSSRGGDQKLRFAAPLDIEFRLTCLKIATRYQQFFRRDRFQPCDALADGERLLQR